jgi:S-adenosylmethionine:tRNA ribosyltransferase-isomerase
MRVDQFDFELPDELIALRPAVPRDRARMLVVAAEGGFTHAYVCDLAKFLHAGDTLVVNDTAVVKARLIGRRGPRQGQHEGPRVECLLHHRLTPHRFLAFARPARKLVPGDMIAFSDRLRAEVAARGEGGEVELTFGLGGAALDAAIARQGEVPLPPYIAAKRRTDARDESDYQTLFARHAGSVAAPTAGLHFTRELLDTLLEAGIGRESVTLHVGAGTFLPVSAEDTDAHRMHPERAELTQHTADRLNAVHDAQGRVVAVGTTSLRTLESAATPDGRIHPFSSETAIFITPGYKFRAADVLLTNFHLPRSTLFMLVSAFSGLETMRRAYTEAIRERYRFYSYGDACLLFRRP